MNIKKYWKKPKPKFVTGAELTNSLRFSRPVAFGVVILIALAGLILLILSRAAPVPNNSADRWIWWACPGTETSVNNDNKPPRRKFDMTDAELDTWKSRGVGGFACNIGLLPSTGGTGTAFNVSPGANITGSQYDYQRQIRDSNIVARLHARGMKLYLGFYTQSYYTNATPFTDWFNDGGWAGSIIPDIRNMAEAAKFYGMDGLALDQEWFNGATPQSWCWQYPGNDNSQIPEATVRGKVRQRGREIQTAVQGVFPGVEWLAYDTILPGGWEAYARENRPLPDTTSPDFGTFGCRVNIDLWDGITSVEGYSAIRFIDAWFYKGTGYCVGSGQNWDTALQYNANRIYSLLSRRWSNWSYASERFYLSPFAWIDTAPWLTACEGQNSPEVVNGQLQAFRKWGTGGETANYSYNSILPTDRDFNYTNYVSAMRSAAVPSVVDSQAPGLVVTGPAVSNTYNTSAGSLNLAGRATDNMAIRRVTWRSDRGGNGAATMNWQVNSGDYNVGYNWQMNWSANSVPLQTGQNVITITAEDIKGLTSTFVLTVNPGAGGTPAPAPPPTPTPLPPPPPPPTPTPPALTILKVASAPLIDGNLTEYTNANGVTFGTPQTSNSATVKALWGSAGLYLAYQVNDTQLNAQATTQDGSVWADDAVEWFVDTLNNGCSVNPDTTACMLADDYQGIVNLLNAHYDTRGTASGSPDTSTNFAWASATSLQGTIGGSDTDSGYSVEIHVPWSSLGLSGAPANETQMRLGLALDDRDAASAYVMWPNRTSAFQNASHWQVVSLSGTVVAMPPAPSKTGDINGDNQVNVFDLSVLLSRWDTGDTNADLNRNNKVDVFDLSILLSKWGS